MKEPAGATTRPARTRAAGRERPSRRSRKTSRELITAARDVLGENGVGGLTVKAVTARAEVGHGTFYHHFESSEHVLGAVIEASMQELAETLVHQHSAAKDKAWVVVDSTASVFGMLRTHPALGWMLERPAVMASALRRVLEPYVRQDVEALAASSGIDVAHSGRMASFWPWMVVGALAASREHPSTHREIERNLVEAVLRLIGLEPVRVHDLQRRRAARARRTRGPGTER